MGILRVLLGLLKAVLAGLSMFVWYSPYVTVAATALRDSQYCPAVTSHLPVLYS